MLLRWIDTEEMTRIYEERMKIDFPDSELKPLSRIVETMEAGLCKALVMEEEHIVYAYAVFILPENGKHLLLDYFAVNQVFRGSGIGHRFFDLLRPFLQDRFPDIEGVFIETEIVEADLPKEDRQIRERRIAFYYHCGCEKTKLESCLFGVTFSILYFRLKGDSMVKYEDLDYVYVSMFVKEHYRTQVKIWEKANEV